MEISTRLSGMADADAAAGAGMKSPLAAIAHMFSPYRDDPIMRELCRLAVKCEKERSREADN